MAQYHGWLRQVTGNFRHRPLLVGFDAMWVHWYEWRILGDQPTRNSSLDLKSVAVGIQGGPWHPALQSPRPAPRAVDCYVPAAPDAHAQAVNTPGTARLASAAAKPNVPPMARPAPSPRATGTAERSEKR